MSQRFKNIVLKYAKENYPNVWMVGDSECLYGYDPEFGFTCRKKMDFSIITVFLTIDEFEQLINNKTIMKTKEYKVTREQMQTIHNIACTSWKEKIEEISINIFGAFKNEGNIDESTVKKMFDASNNSQIEILNKIFPDFNKNELPIKWEDLKELNGYYIEENCEIEDINNCNIVEANKNILPTKKLAKQMLILCQLLYLRDIYRQGWEPVYKNSYYDDIKYYISYIGNAISCNSSISGSYILSFQSIEIRDKFLENFRDLIEEAKDLL